MSRLDDDLNLQTLVDLGFEVEIVACDALHLLNTYVYLANWIEPPEIIAWCQNTCSFLQLKTPIECLAEGRHEAVMVAGHQYVTSGNSARQRRFSEAKRQLGLRAARIEQARAANEPNVYPLPTGAARAARLAQRRLRHPSRHPRPR